jgi:hypothetical protein
VKRALGLVVLAACASSEKPARTEVAIAFSGAPPPATSSTSSSTPAVLVARDAGDDDDLLNMMMNDDDAGSHNDSDDALFIMMTEPKKARHGTPVVRLDTDTSDTGIPRAVVRRIVRQNFAKLRACYERGLASVPNMSGRLVVRFTVDRSGSVTSATSAAPTTIGGSVTTCILDAFRVMKFPEPQGGSVIVNYPIVFEP